MALPIIKIENARGEVLNLSTDPRYEPMLQSTGPPAATINRSKVALADGTRFNSSSVGERNPLLTIYLRQDVARARLNLYRYITTGANIKLYYQADGLDVYIEGCVETAEVDPWTEDENMQVSIICPQPYWKDIAESIFNASVSSKLLEFPFAIGSEGAELSMLEYSTTTTIENRGHVQAGATFELVAKVRSLQPRIYNLSTGEYMGFDVDMLAGDRLVIDTRTGSKAVTLIRAGVRTNYFNTLIEGSEFLQLPVGASEFYYTVDEGMMDLYIHHTNMYQGV